MSQTRVVDTLYESTSSARVATPERIVLPGPGNTLGGVCAQVLIELGWRGLGAREDFDRVQASASPVLESLRR
jgi:hypothetical protein